MRSLRECPSCRALLTPEQRSAAGRACPYCGRPTDDLLDDDDPFAPQGVTVVEDATTPLDAPRDFWGKLKMAASLFLGQLPLYAALVLTVWLPGNAIVELVDVTNANPNPENALAIVFLRVLVEVVFGPIYAGGIITALALRMSGAKIGYVEAMRAGIHHWARLLGARLIAGALTILGVIALIVPGIIFAVRFALVDEAVVVEGLGPSLSRFRSIYLTRGKGRPIALAWALHLATNLALSDWLDRALKLAAPWSQPVLTAVGLCLAQVLFVFFTCLFFLIYWQAREDELAGMEGLLAKHLPAGEDTPDMNRA